MSDANCAKCNEPWEVNHLRHEEPLWVWKLFCAGAGCPTCEGAKLSGVDSDEAMLQQAKSVALDGAWDDPHAFASVNNLGLDYTPPVWQRPEDTVLWECDDCRSRVKHNVDEPAKLVRPRMGRPWVDGLYWEGGRFAEMYNHDEEEENDILLLSMNDANPYLPKVGPPKERMIEGRAFCNYCAETCSECGRLTEHDEIVLEENDFRGNHPVCQSCLEDIPRCSECGAWLDDDDEQDDKGRGPCCAEGDE